MDNRIKIPPEMNGQPEVFNNLYRVHGYDEDVGKIGEYGKKDAHVI